MIPLSGWEKYYPKHGFIKMQQGSSLCIYIIYSKCPLLYLLGLSRRWKDVYPDVKDRTEGFSVIPSICTAPFIPFLQGFKQTCHSSLCFPVLFAFLALIIMGHKTKSMVKTLFQQAPLARKWVTGASEIFRRNWWAVLEQAWLSKLWFCECRPHPQLSDIQLWNCQTWKELNSFCFWWL